MGLVAPTLLHAALKLLLSKNVSSSSSGLIISQVPPNVSPKLGLLKILKILLPIQLSNESIRLWSSHLSANTFSAARTPIQ